jgi:hypothetical protein
MLIDCSLWRMRTATVIHAKLLPTAQGADARPFPPASFRFSAFVHLLCLNFRSLVSLRHFFRWKFGASRSALKLQALALTRTFSHVNTRCLAHSLTPLRAFRSRPYKLSSWSTFPLFSCFAPAAVFCRRGSTCCVLAPKRALLQLVGFLSSFAERYCTHPMTCSFRVKVIYGHLHTSSA